MKEKHLDTGHEKVQKICDLLTKQTIDPAKQQAHEIVENAHLEAKKMIEKANQEKERIICEGKKQAEDNKKVVEASLNLACKQVIDALKQEIESKIFDENLQELVKETIKQPELIQEMILSFVHMIKEQGLDADLDIVVPKAFPLKPFNQMIAKQGFEMLQEKSIRIGDFEGGIQIKLKEQKITIDISDAALKEMLARYTREDFRNMIFKA